MNKLKEDKNRGQVEKKILTLRKEKLIINKEDMKKRKIFNTKEFKINVILRIIKFILILENRVMIKVNQIREILIDTKIMIGLKDIKTKDFNTEKNQTKKILIVA